MKLTTIHFFFLFFLAVANVIAETRPVTQGEAYLEDFLANTRTLEATFQQTLRTHEGEVLQQTEGEFYLNRPGRFRWNYRSPYEQVIVSDGERVWIYDVELQQVTVQKQSASLPATPMALLEDSSTLHNDFEVTPLDENQGVYRLKLMSRSKESDFGEIVVGLDASGLRFMQLHDQFEQVTDIVFSNIHTNKKLSQEIFEFIPPEGVDVFGG
ncbi:MAG: outer membrane lipoprotein chaperone LolA [Gammaproteobacteria bacterium]|nr:outer membrane lipoprotein chaperone LolA [Gammaproteobacteria bacterium]MBT8134571.1 outer membrane lipoprotein chaperone LolA [Gammaproteobacteria bacterium]NNJ50109.1 outer membrane lipoprotein chaperone LolA [Gammaproteobacteria bacterium]